MTNYEVAPGPTRVLTAIIYMMVSVGSYAIQDVIIKALPPHYHVFQIVFLRCLFAFIPVVMFAAFEQEKRFFSTKYPKLHFWRALFSTLALFCFVAAFRLIPLAESYALTFSCPLFMTLLCVPLLKETVSKQRWIAVITGFIGVLFMFRPGAQAFNIGGLIAVLGGLFYAISLVYVRKLSRTENNTMIVLTFTIMSTIISGLIAPFYWQPIEPTLYYNFILIGLLGGSAQYAMTQAFRLAPVSIIAPFDYAALLWALFLGYTIWGDIPDAFSMAGITIIVISGIYLARHEHKQQNISIKNSYQCEQQRQ